MTDSVWVVVPAAGVGKRMGSVIPKQYLPLAGKTVLQHTIEKLAALEFVSGIVVSVSPADGWWDDLEFDVSKPLIRVDGGTERVHSVFNGLRWLCQQGVEASQWVMVHDAARPCFAASDVISLWSALKDDRCGGILAVPVRDTMKRGDGEGRILETVDRRALWHALTPQLFRFDVLHSALSYVLGQPGLITDEASALEACGFSPRLVEGRADNIKITRPEDLALAEFYLHQELLEANEC